MLTCAVLVGNNLKITTYYVSAHYYAAELDTMKDHLVGTTSYVSPLLVLHDSHPSKHRLSTAMLGLSIQLSLFVGRLIFRCVFCSFTPQFVNGNVPLEGANLLIPQFLLKGKFVG
jgi:hypothetical protein